MELIRARVVSVEAPIMRFGKNPRRLQLETAEKTLLDLSIHDRRVVPRSGLEMAPPDPAFSLSGATLKVLVEWVAKRYTRPAFPDAFNERRAPANRRIEKVLKRDGKLLTGLFLMIDPNDECSAESVYRISLRTTATGETLADSALELQLSRATAQLAEALDECSGIEVVGSDLVSETEFTLADLQYFSRWDWDYRSHSGEPGGEIVPVP